MKTIDKPAYPVRRIPAVVYKRAVRAMRAFTPSDAEPLLNDAEAARFLGGLHPKTVQRMARRGALPAYRVGKYWRYRASELNTWLLLHSTGQNNPSAQPRKELQ